MCEGSPPKVFVPICVRRGEGGGEWGGLCELPDWSPLLNSSAESGGDTHSEKEADGGGNSSGGSSSSRVSLM